MPLLEKFLSRNYTFLKVFIIVIVFVIIIITETFNHFYFHKYLVNSIFDGITSLILAIALVLFTFYIIGFKQKQLNDQLNQLTEAYQYIGQMNRKIDALLEIDISTLDRSNNLPAVKSFEVIFNQLVNLIGARSGYLYLKPPFDFKLQANKAKPLELAKIFDNLRKIEAPIFKYSKHPESSEFFQSLEISEDLLKKYHFVTKPVYMHNQDIGVMLLAFNNSQALEDRDFNIIRVFSFYLALNATFKPDFSSFQT